MAVIDDADLLPPGDGYQSLSVIGTSGATSADDHQNVQLVYRGGHPSAVWTDESGGQILALAGKHVIQDKPMATRRADADRLVDAVERAGVRFLMWNRNFFPAVVHAREAARTGQPVEVH